MALTVEWKGTKRPEIRLVHSDKGVLHVEAAALMATMGGTIKNLDAKGIQIGLCTDDACIPVNLDDPQQGYKKDNTTYLVLSHAAVLLELDVKTDDAAGLVRLSPKTKLGTVATKADEGVRHFPEMTLDRADGSRKKADAKKLLAGKRALVYCFASW